MRKLFSICLFFTVLGFVAAQEQTGQTEDFRGSIPVELLRPARGESPRYPVDTVIGEMGQGEASDAAFSFANWVAGGLISGRMAHPALEQINPVLRESYLSTIGNIEPRSYRIGGGREEADGSTSFLVRFIGREYGITAEMYVKHVITRIPQEPLRETLSEETAINNEENEFVETEIDDIITAESEDADENTEIAEAEDEHPLESEIVYTTVGSWVLDELFLDDARSREEEQKFSANRMDYTPYERFF